MKFPIGMLLTAMILGLACPVAARDPGADAAAKKRDPAATRDPGATRDPAAPARPAEPRREGGAVPVSEKGGGPPADFADERYGPHDRNVFDLWCVDAREPTPLL